MQLLDTVCNQLLLSFGAAGNSSSEGQGGTTWQAMDIGDAVGGRGGIDKEAAPFGVAMVDELLPDSFLRRGFASFFETLSVRALVPVVTRLPTCSVDRTRSHAFTLQFHVLLGLIDDVT
jgi:hypothetical protein